MKRLYVNLNVADLNASIAFYSTLFAAEPAVQKADYAKWLLEDPRVNFAISTHGTAPGVVHLGIQVEETDPQGIAWETFLTTGDAEVYAPEPAAAPRTESRRCC